MKEKLFHPKVQLLVRVVLGGILVYASWHKIADPPDFAKIIYNYRLFPESSIHMLAVFVPWIELVAGLALISGIWLRGGALMAAVFFTFFIVFADFGDSHSVVAEEMVKAEILLDISDSWHVNFEKNRGAPSEIYLDKLYSLSAHEDNGVKYFSGIATYKKTIDLPKTINTTQPVLLDLGEVADVAEVIINGKYAGTELKHNNEDYLIMKESDIFAIIS